MGRRNFKTEVYSELQNHCAPAFPGRIVYLANAGQADDSSVSLGYTPTSHSSLTLFVSI